MMMKQLKWIALVSTAFLVNIPSVCVYGQDVLKQEDDANIIRLETLDCRYLLKQDSSHREATVVFFHGFMSGKNSELTLDIDKLDTVSGKVIDHCIKKPNHSLLRVFERYR